ncbi:membrane-associated tyrosine- and threonine-specific cdc2-inhibitory kinase isoform X3 [Gallus gallus]|uniref:membrane-associated tyrosine- and threonine-specific cdc2-inhibitory kinase isoform X3 n=1 Tax=Gallus gallus TaxID=9031 RepID=UPI001F019190|nr:membrane-associated tyrosine- and threonine-specific cdc2-inhibitory kinase isoform X3 [Gallus gallus]
MSHGDVRPSNAMLDGGRCLLGDFGWCGEEGGSGRYAAPEAAEATAEAATAEGDVFSLGLTVAEVALGERADDGETWTELRGGRLPHALRAALPPELLPLLAAMLDPDPQRRPTAEALLQSAPMRRVGRWRPLLRLLDVGLRRGAELLQPHSLPPHCLHPTAPWVATKRCPIALPHLTPQHPRGQPHSYGAPAPHSHLRGGFRAP